MHIDLKYDRDNDDLQSDIEFAARRRYVARAMVPPGYEQYFRDQARFLSAHTSTAIEGNPLDPQEAQLVLIHGADIGEPNELETQNTQVAYELISELGADKSLRIDQGLIRALNSLLLKGLPGRAAERRGTYRVGGSQIVDAATRTVRYNPPPPEWVPDLMEDLEANIRLWTGTDAPPVVAAKVHFGLISIHPFEDGNGRTARLLADLVVHQTGWSVEGMISISAILLERRQAYYGALRDAQGLEFVTEVDVTPFVLFHTAALRDAVTRLEEKVVGFNLRRDEWAHVNQGTLNERQVIGLMYMLDLGALSTTTYAKLSKCSAPTALTDLQAMIAMGVVRREGAGKSTRYAADPTFAEAAHSR